ncbi:hypothetical protein MKX08_010141 [Trichoderma sp. CBMAI-0020]|nr:hypothetical protein MKX08_010141 [Trichoderma sp. CBMAI-0020]WOD46360.1 hypothetical protein [Trichoderma atroviride]
MDQQIRSGSYSGGVSRLFAPLPSDQLLISSLDNIPTYLFRVSDHISPGTTNPTEVCSPAFTNLQQSADLCGMKREQAADNLRDHLWWNCTSGDSIKHSCNLMSWTSSLLSALQYAFYRHNYWNKGNEDFSDTFILIVDTRQFERGAFARDLEVMEAYKGISTGRRSLDDLYELRRSGRFYFGEYLSQGRLNFDPERVHQVTLGNLIQRGLFDINPELKDEAQWSRWAHRVNQLRFSIQKGPIDVQRSDIQAAMNVAEAFQPFAVPVAAMLLTIGPYKLDCKAPIILKELRSRYTENNISGLLWTNIGPVASLPELQGYKKLIDHLKQLMTIRIEDIERKSERSRTMKADVEDLIAAVNDLNV